MSEWSVCPHCSLKFRRRPDGQCPRCHQPVGEEGGDAGAPMPDVYDGRATRRAVRETSRDAAPPSSAQSRLGSVIWGALILVAIGALVRQRDQIAGVFRDLTHQERLVLEVSEFRCDREWMDLRTAGAVKNIGDKPLSLSVNLGLRLGPRTTPRPINTGNHVQPYPLAPGSTGRFDFKIPLSDPSAGKCLLHSFTDDARGEAMNYTADERLNAR